MSHVDLTADEDDDDPKKTPPPKFRNRLSDDEMFTYSRSPLNRNLRLNRNSSQIQQDQAIDWFYAMDTGKYDFSKGVDRYGFKYIQFTEKVQMLPMIIYISFIPDNPPLCTPVLKFGGSSESVAIGFSRCHAFLVNNGFIFDYLNK